jgi:hypothetical protein
MSLLNSLAKRSSKYKDLERLVAKQKKEIKALKAELKERKARAKDKVRWALEEVEDKRPGIYPIPRLLLVRPSSEDIAGSLLELVGMILAGRMAHRAVVVDWRDGAPGRNAFWDYFLSSHEVLRRRMKDVDAILHTRKVPALPAPAETTPEAFEEWKSAFNFDKQSRAQVLIAQADPWWRERLPEEWLSQLSHGDKMPLHDVERVALMGIFKPRRALREETNARLAGVPLHRTLGVLATPGLSPDDISAALAARKLDHAWILADSPQAFEPFRAALGDRVLPLAPGTGPLSVLGALHALSHATALLLPRENDSARLTYLLSGLRPDDVTWLS